MDIVNGVMALVDWCFVNKVAIGEAYLALIGFASIVIKLTPNVSDDNWLKKYLRFTGKFIALNRK